MLARAVRFLVGSSRALDGEAVQRCVVNCCAHTESCCARWTEFRRYDEAGVSVWNALSRASSLQHFRGRTEEEAGFLYIATTFRTRRSFDPRDKIYGMLGLARGRFAELRPDYEREASEVFESVVLLSVEETGSLGALSYVYGESKLGLGLPSFVPDWTAEVQEAWHKSFMDRSILTAYFDASNGSRAALDLATPGKATTRAVFVDTIAELEDPDYQDWKQMVDECRKMARLEDRFDVQYTSRTAAFWQTMCGGIISLTDESSGLHLRRVEETDYPSYQRWQAWVDSVLSSELVLDGVDDFQVAFNAVIAGRSFVITDKGYIGFAPEESTKGDLVALFPGGKVPYVLRPKADDCYVFLGDAYIHGIMDGEAFDEAKFETVTLV